MPLERASLHQTRFRTPGVRSDARGVVLGRNGLVLFPSVDRLVAFLRAYGHDSSLDELLPSLVIRSVVTPLRTREITLSIAADSSYRMDRIAGVAKLAGGLVFTGTSRHFVKYRDAASPVGYDIQELVDDPGDLALYHDTFDQTYTFERELAFRDIVLRLTPHRVPRSTRPVPERLLATAEIGVGGALATYLFRWQVDADVALAEWPSQSAFDDGPRRLHIFDMRDVPPRIVQLMEALPGVRVFEPLRDNVAIELGFEHPISLESCAGLFDDESLLLFRGDGETDQLSPKPPLVPVRTIVRTELGEVASANAGSPVPTDLRWSLPIRLAPTPQPWRSVVATVVPMTQRGWLARLLYVLPPNTLSSLLMAIAKDRFYLINRSGIAGMPLGTFFSEVADRVYVPSGFALVPAIAPGIIEELLSDRADGHAFFELDSPRPNLVPAAAFGPLSRRALAGVAGTLISADRPDNVEPPLPLFQYGEAKRFPLFSLPGQDTPGRGGPGGHES